MFNTFAVHFPIMRHVLECLDETCREYSTKDIPHDNHKMTREEARWEDGTPVMAEVYVNIGEDDFAHIIERVLSSPYEVTIFEENPEGRGFDKHTHEFPDWESAYAFASLYGQVPVMLQTSMA